MPASRSHLFGAFRDRQGPRSAAGVRSHPLPQRHRGFAKLSPATTDARPVPFRRRPAIRNHRFDGNASRRDLGYEPATALDAGLPRFVDWYSSFHDVAAAPMRRSV
jgi:nucleoside-diphosphate-sugar epimerase